MIIFFFKWDGRKKTEDIKTGQENVKLDLSIVSGTKLLISKTSGIDGGILSAHKACTSNQQFIFISNVPEKLKFINILVLP